jgi:DNA-binding CsgD family transcriptional regulator
MALLPLLTVIGDYQWITFPIVNTSFFLIIAIEVDRYIFLLKNRGKVVGIIDFYDDLENNALPKKFISEGLTLREIEIAVSILDDKNYKEIGEEFYIAERTVSKHASNIFKKTGVKNKTEFVERFVKKSI